MITKKYAKMLLSKVSFDQELFKKELAKVLKWLDEKDSVSIKLWVKRKYKIEDYQL